uniref:Uncharacterized protein n=1 Tax=Anguilla anguilla TaxID=7936 RepID=A0A0E9X6Q0_ANGAN
MTTQRHTLQIKIQDIIVSKDRETVNFPLALLFFAVLYQHGFGLSMPASHGIMWPSVLQWECRASNGPFLICLQSNTFCCCCCCCCCLCTQVKVG